MSGTMKTTILIFWWVILALAAAKAVQNKKCKHDGCNSLSYDELLKYFEDDNFTAISDEVSQQLDGDMPTEKEWLDIINALRNGKKPMYLNLGEQRLLFHQNQTGDYNFSSGMKIDLNNTIYGNIERTGRMGSYSSLTINLMKTTAPSAVELPTATGSYMRVYFSLAEDTVTWQGAAKALLFFKYPNGTFYRTRSQSLVTKGKAERKKGNTIAVTTKTFVFGMVKLASIKTLASSNYSLDFVEGRPGNVSGTIEISSMLGEVDANTTFSFHGDFPREGKGNFLVHSSANIITSKLPLPIDIEVRAEGYTSFDGSQPFSNENLPSIFNSQFWGAGNY